MQRDFYLDMPPWGSITAWQAANDHLDFIIRRNLSTLDQALALAQKVRTRLASIHSLLDDLCGLTCPWCPDSCCLTARVWIDFKDLLFLHLIGHSIPRGQLSSSFQETCRYLSPRGCKLPRISRPWVCTWYLCPTQKANLYHKDRHVQDRFSQAIAAIKLDRNEMEAEFIRIVS